MPACSDLGQGRVTPGRDHVAGRGDLRALGRGRLVAALRGLLALHHVEHDLLEIGLPAGERDDLRLQVLQLAGGRDLPGVEPLAVPVDAAAHLIDVCLRLGQRALEVALLGLEGGDGVAQPRVTLLELIEFRVLGEAPAPVLEPRQLGVEVGKLKQPQLRLGRCFHGSPR